MKKQQTRRAFLKTLPAGAAACAGVARAAIGAVQDARPNIVVVMSDDMGYSDLGCYGGEIRTPNLDGLAAQGLRFTQFHSCDMCVPSRASLMTGIYAIASRRDGHLNPHCATLPELLRNAGYATAMAGKWHLSGTNDVEHYPCQHGFDRYFGTITGANSYYQPISLKRGNASAENEYKDNPAFYYTQAITGNAVRFIQEATPDKPLFLYVAYTAAHWPLHALPEDIAQYKGRYRDGWDMLRATRYARMRKLGVIPENAALSPRNPEVPAWEDERNKAWQERRMEVYAAQVTRMDRGVGEIVEALKGAGRFDNTLLLYTIDNGGCHVEFQTTRDGEWLPKKTRDGRDMIPGNIPNFMPGPENTFQSYGYGWANASNTPFRLYKLHAHEGGVHTPLIAHWPGVIANPGGLTSERAHLIDILPTCVEAAGAEIPGRIGDRKLYPVDGISLVPVLRGQSRQGHKQLCWDWANGQAILAGQWKLVRVKKGPWELYDIEADPSELNNLVDRMPEKAKELERAWQEWNDTYGGME